MVNAQARLCAIAAAIALVAACRAKAPASDSVATVVTGDTLAIAREFAEPPRDSNLVCTPSVVGASDTLRMAMTLPHGATFHVATPDGTPFIVVFHGEGDRDRGQRKSLVPPDSFAKLTRLDLPIATLKAGAWVFGRDTNERLFVQPGFYRLRVGSDMETDGPRYAECVVRLRPR
jgi:hypothetical protein